ncbi:hypothetical protein F5B22DRAFT_652043 [Xylaria bambusicola]|uniref:uncharacterized protein n=1 Tax=Xylaria bambusicola TaxID=326684 RepID=UPI0020088224|nr:uncharacterized protein F5B22DRAFT_652043 [Xylaria bambusicola]KAI0505128.1 hypothetical protein F5B22DRAFT_652043 [Xylaria bambusicola]
MSIRARTGPSRCIAAATVHTYYPGRQEEITQGKSYQEIADLIDQYVKIVILTATTLPLNLDNLYGTVFPEDRKLTLEAHDTGVDVLMAYRLAIAYLRRALDMHLPGKSDSWLSPTMKSGKSGWKICDEEANDFLTRLQEAGVGNDQTYEVLNDGEEEEEEIALNFHEIFSGVEDEELRDSNEDGGDLDNYFHNLGSDVDDKEEARDYDDDDETGDCDEVTSDGDDDDYVDG